ncbi:MAG: LEA type 2 family protein, partial [Gemmatimonadota bacterium]|nr:LEA type 2 family protein [Gemmatimonadota bacterium]
MRYRRRLWPLSALLLSACAQLTFQHPTTQLVTVAVTAISLEGGALRLALDVHNPNGYELRATRMALGVDLEATHFGNAELTEALRLPARQTTRVDVPVRFAWTGVGAGARALLSRGVVRYALDGRLFVDTPLGT